MILYLLLHFTNEPLETMLAFVHAVSVFTLYSFAFTMLHGRFATPSFLDVAPSALLHVNILGGTVDSP